MRQGVEAALAAARGKGYVAMTEDCASTEARYLAAYLLCQLLAVPLVPVTCCAAYLLCRLLAVPLTCCAAYLLCRLLAVPLTSVLCYLPPTTEARYLLRALRILRVSADGAQPARRQHAALRPVPQDVPRPGGYNIVAVTKNRQVFPAQVIKGAAMGCTPPLLLTTTHYRPSGDQGCGDGAPCELPRRRRAARRSLPRRVRRRYTSYQVVVSKSKDDRICTRTHMPHAHVHAHVHVHAHAHAHAHAGHSGYSHGVPERLLAAQPQLAHGMVRTWSEP
eukprot:scaffold53213_cov62-Phaeocystis_antarctica.AAC.1